MRLPARYLAAVLACAACMTPEAAPFDPPPTSTPQLFAPGVVSTGQREYGIAFSPDFREAYFTRRGRRGPPVIFASKFGPAGWSEPVRAPFSRDGDELPFISTDGTRLVFSSRRPLPLSRDQSGNIWEIERTPEGWGEPVPLPGLVNEPLIETDDFTTGNESGPVLVRDGTLIYSAFDPDFGMDLYMAHPDERGSYEDPKPLLLNGVGDERHPAVSPDGLHLVFQGYLDARGVGDQDLYVSTRTPIGWGRPRLLPEPINSERNDGYPSFSPDGRFFFFASDRDGRGGYYSIYYVDIEALGLDSDADGLGS